MIRTSEHSEVHVQVVVQARPLYSHLEHVMAGIWVCGVTQQVDLTLLLSGFL